MKSSAKKITVFLAVRYMDGEDIIKVFGSYDSVDCLYDYIEETTISEKTYNKLISGDYYAKRYGNDIRAYSC